jgi:hypothetical protein
LRAKQAELEKRVAGPSAKAERRKEKVVQ